MTKSAARLCLARHTGLGLCAVLAVSALPTKMFPLPWISAMLLPALLAFLIVRRLPLRPTEHVLLAGILQVAAIALCLSAVGPLDRLAAIGCTLLPPLAYLVLRAEPLDVLRALFLAFCVLLIGTILGEPSTLQILGFLVVAVLTLHLDVATSAIEERASFRGRPLGGLRRLGNALSISLAAIAAFLVSLQVLRALPNPERERAPASRTARRPASPSVGLSSDFDFGNIQGSLLSLRSDRLVDVASADGRPVPTDLYLRQGQFDVAGLDRWGARRAREAPLGFDDGVARVSVPSPGAPERELRIRIVEPGDGFAYVPPGTHAIGGNVDLVGSRRAAVFRFRAPPVPGTSYRVRFHTHRADEVDDLPDTPLAGLMEIGSDLRPVLRYFDDILRQPHVEREVEPMRVARAIARELQSRCTYALREPRGPHAHSLLNFLDGDRSGFCMHFASATAICLRRAGIPARIGVGLYGGEPSPDDYGSRSYGSRHAHAWVEVPFAGLGWVVFDPTPPAARQNLGWPDIDVGPGGEGEAGASSSTVVVVRRERLLERVSQAWPIALALALVWAIARLRFVRRVARGASAARRPTAEERSARRLLERVLHDLARRGHARHPGETLERFAGRLRRHGIGGPRLRDAFAAYQEVRFGARPFDSDRRDRLQPDLGELERLA